MNRDAALKVVDALTDEDYSCTMVAAVVPPKFRTPETGAVNYYVTVLGPATGVHSMDVRTLLTIADANDVALRLTPERNEVLFETRARARPEGVTGRQA